MVFMNERIRELLHQCSVPDDQAEEYSKSKGLVIPDQKLDVAKFAELIIKECADVAYKYNRCDWADVSKSIKQHFGVEL